MKNEIKWLTECDQSMNAGNYQKYSLGLLCIGNYLKSLTTQCNRPIRMEFAAHTFRCRLESCQRQKKKKEKKTNYCNVHNQSNETEPPVTLTLHIASLNHKIAIALAAVVDTSYLMTLIKVLKMILIHSPVPAMQSI